MSKLQKYKESKVLKAALALVLAGVLMIGNMGFQRITAEGAAEIDGMFLNAPVNNPAADLLAEYIENYIHDGVGTLTAIADGNTVTVTGNVTFVFNKMDIDIPDDITVIWKAVYRGRGVRLLGTGDFIVAGNGVIHTTLDAAIDFLASAKVVVRDNAVVSSATPAGAIRNWMNDPDSVIEVTDNGSVISYFNGFAIFTDGTGTMTVTVSGNGSVINRGTGNAIEATNVTINENGLVLAEAGLAVMVFGSTSGTINLNGGAVFAHGTSLSDVIFGTAEYNGGVVIAWDKAAFDAEGSGFFYSLAPPSSEHLVFNAGASAVWDVVNNRDGISYANGGNSGFFVVNGAKVGSVRYDVIFCQTDTFTFPAKCEGYEPFDIYGFTLTNIGNISTGALRVTTTGGNIYSFALFEEFSGDWYQERPINYHGGIRISEYELVGIKPNDNLTRGTYSTTVTVDVTGGNTNPITPKAFDVSFTVNPPCNECGCETCFTDGKCGDCCDCNDCPGCCVCKGSGTPCGDCCDCNDCPGCCACNGDGTPCGDCCDCNDCPGCCACKGDGTPCGDCCDCNDCPGCCDCNDCSGCYECNDDDTPPTNPDNPNINITPDIPNTTVTPDTSDTTPDTSDTTPDTSDTTPDTSDTTPDSSDDITNNQDNQDNQDNQIPESTAIIVTDAGDVLFMFSGKFEDLEIVFLNDIPFRTVVVDNGDSWDLYLHADVDYGLGEGYAYHFSVGKAFEGSTAVLIYDEFIRTLRNGTYTIMVMFKDGTFGTMEFEVEGNYEPEYADQDVNPATGVVVSFIPLVLAGTAIVFSKTRIRSRIGS
jgi:hypothetical protein